MAETISLEDKLNLLRLQPYFAGMSEAILSDIANLMQEMEFAENQIIAEEGDLVDSFYLIAKGRVSISQITESSTEAETLATDANDQPTPQVIATLGVGEAIGLSATGFFSQTGARTATVTSLTTTVLLSIKLKDFELLLKQHPSLLPNLQAATTIMLRMSFIKQLLPFSTLSVSDLKWLAEQVIEIHITAGDILFKQGDYGASAYLIEEGAIDILSKDESSGEEIPIATLHAPNIFGEAAVLLDTPRNATAIAHENSTLLLLNRIHLEQLNEKKATYTKALATMVIERSRPIRSTGITVHHSEAEDKELIITLCNSATNKYYQLSEPSWYVWQLLDGLKSMRDITLLFLHKYSQFSPNVLTALIIDLAQQGFIEVKGMFVPSEEEELTFWGKASVRLTKIMEAKYTFKHVDDFLQTIYNKVSFLFKPISVYIGILFMFSGFVAFGINAPHIIYELHHYPLHKIFIILIMMNFITLPFVFVHECGHGLTTKHFGHKVNGLGFGWYWLGPIAFCDTSDMWLGTQRQRVLVNSAGLFLDAIRAGIFAWIGLLIPIPAIQIFFWLYALSTLSMVYTNFNPILEFDGYYILSDLLNEMDLRENAVVWLTNQFPKILRDPKQVIFGHKHEVIFWLACLGHILVGGIIAWVSQRYILSIIFPHLAQSHWSWLFPFIIIVGALLSVRGQIKQANTSKQEAEQDFATTVN